MFDIYEEIEEYFEIRCALIIIQLDYYKRRELN